MEILDAGDGWLRVRLTGKGKEEEIQKLELKEVVLILLVVVLMAGCNDFKSDDFR